MSGAGAEGAAWETVIGLEVHCELRTNTKLFCGCPNAFGDEPNTNVCPVCLGLPGSLPVINRRAVELAMRIGTALHCEIKPSIFHRKNYFYPDMPKDYQVSQYDEPINVDGHIDLPDGSRVRIERAHMEEDTGKTTHVGGGGRIHDAEHSLVDYNRAGVPLVEIVSAPDIRSAEQARAYVSELRAILVATGASDGRMEEGSLRVDANISMRPAGATEFGTRCEVKNMNSLRSLGRAIEYEAARQIALLEEGGSVTQETRHWNEDTGKTSSLRSKEEAYDYRYFPEPDLVPLDPDADFRAAARDAVGLLPADRRERLSGLLGEEAVPRVGTALGDQIVTLVTLGLDDLVVEATGLGAPAKLALTRVANEVAADVDGARGLQATGLAEVLLMEADGKLGASQTKQVLAEMLGGASSPSEIVERLGFASMGDDALAALVDEVIAANPAEWQRYCDGDDKVAGFLLGQIMRIAPSKPNGKAVAEAFSARRG
ncbi:MAG TPA: Asp-tRNA(Asn)/Glu-tRNA(Gln) amidotransferase subunit GatB [Acidimicrobiales bacterium]|nr:Asp-tRNA(Asn)/Glu-tRNA(Gln) amidotransferase subunit GatB [Acidimicrobiales bacterium]